MPAGMSAKGTLTDFDAKRATYSTESKHPVTGSTFEGSIVIDFAAKTKAVKLHSGMKMVELHGE